MLTVFKKKELLVFDVEKSTCFKKLIYENTGKEDKSGLL